MFEDPDRWHGDLLRAWDTNLPSKMEEAIAQNYESLEKAKMLGMASLMHQSLI